MGKFATGKFALGLCDICGFQYKLSELRELVVRKKLTGEKACPTCWDPDHPQNMQGMYRIEDPQALRDPSPDIGRAQSIGFFGWNPVFVPINPVILGRVTIV